MMSILFVVIIMVAVVLLIEKLVETFSRNTRTVTVIETTDESSRDAFNTALQHALQSEIGGRLGLPPVRSPPPPSFPPPTHFETPQPNWYRAIVMPGAPPFELNNYDAPIDMESVEAPPPYEESVIYPPELPDFNGISKAGHTCGKH